MKGGSYDVGIREDMRMGKTGTELLHMFSRRLRTALGGINLDDGGLLEIRLRAGMPVGLVFGRRELFLGPDGRQTEQADGGETVTALDIRETVELMASHSLYAYEEELRQGFLTLPGGHRVGLSGRCVAENGRVRTIKYISSLNIRLARQVKGCGRRLLPFLYENGTFLNTLVISPPCGGKTTLLRDLVRLISLGNSWGKGVSVGVVDERSEIAACFQGVPQNDLGPRTDVLDCCPKAVGMMMMIRSMSPAVVAVDEIGGREDAEALEYAVSCGCRLAATIHGNDLEDAVQKPAMGRLLENGAFQRFVVLDSRHAGHSARVRDRKGNVLAAETDVSGEAPP